MGSARGLLLEYHSCRGKEFRGSRNCFGAVQVDIGGTALVT
jgi:hypothetical protein